MNAKFVTRLFMLLLLGCAQLSLHGEEDIYSEPEAEISYSEAEETTPDSEIALNSNNDGAKQGVKTEDKPIVAKKVEVKKEEKKCEEKKPTEPAFLIPLNLGRCGYLTFKPGLRMQIRYDYDNKTNKNDIFIRRFRVKGGGDAFKVAKYYSEFKIDNVGRFKYDPKCEVERAWLDFPLWENLVYLRVGQYTLPFSRNALTSDAKLLFMERSLIKDQLTALGLADNTVGVLFHGRPWHGHLEYAIGIFDNLKFERIGEEGLRRAKQLMPAGRIAVQFFDPMTPLDGYQDYYETYIGKGHRLAFAANFAFLGKAHEEDRAFNLWAVGGDIFYDNGPWTFCAEFDWYKEQKVNDNATDLVGYGWFVEMGYMFACCLEFALRYQDVQRDVHVSHDRVCWSQVGMNYYIRGHDLKIQSDYTFIYDEELHHRHVQRFEVQLQLDF